MGKGAQIKNPFFISKVSLEDTVFVNSTCEGVFTYKSSWVISICNELCYFAELNVTKIKDTLMNNITLDTKVLSVVIVPLNEQTSEINIVTPTSGNPFEMVTEGSQNIIKNCSSLDMAVPYEKSGSFFSSLMKKKELGKKKMGVGKKLKVPSFSSSSFPIYNEAAPFSSTCEIEETSCLQFRVEIVYSFKECPTTPILMTNNLNVSGSLCNCGVTSTTPQLSPIESAQLVSSCISSRTYCAETNATTVLPAPVFSAAAFPLVCQVQEDCCTSCAPSSSSCQFSKVRCTQTIDVSGQVASSLDQFFSIPGGVSVVSYSVVSSNPLSNTCNIIQNPSDIHVYNCCISGVTQVTTTVDYCIKKTDIVENYPFYVTGTLTSSCNIADFISLNFAYGIMIDAQIVSFDVTKKADNDTPFVCPTLSDFPQTPTVPSMENICKNFTILIPIKEGCLTPSLVLVDQLLHYFNVSAVATINSYSPELSCSIVDQTIQCNTTTSVSNQTLEVHYSLCINNCSFCDINTKTILLQNTAVVTYPPQSITKEAVLNTPLVCPCPSCECTITQTDLVTLQSGKHFEIQSDKGTWPSHYYQGSNCTVTRASDNTFLGHFSYGYYGDTGTSVSWDCVTPSCDQGNPSDCLTQAINQGLPAICDRSFNGPNNQIPHKLLFVSNETFNVYCCALPAPRIASYMSGELNFITCDNSTFRNFTCKGQVTSLSVNDPLVSSSQNPPPLQEDSPSSFMRASTSCKSNINYFQYSQKFTNNGTEDGVISINSLNWEFTGTPPIPTLTFLGWVGSGWSGSPSDLLSPTYFLSGGNITTFLSWNFQYIKDNTSFIEPTSLNFTIQASLTSYTAVSTRVGYSITSCNSTSY